MNKEELDKIIENHALWLSGNGGKRADLSEADLSAFQIVPQKGNFTAWKKTSKGVIEILVTGERTSSLVGRKCRCSECIVIGGDGVGGLDQHTWTIKYSKGAVIKPDSYNDDIRVECTNGIHFFITKEEAEAY